MCLRHQGWFLVCSKYPENAAMMICRDGDSERGRDSRCLIDKETEEEEEIKAREITSKGQREEG